MNKKLVGMGTMPFVLSMPLTNSAHRGWPVKLPSELTRCVSGIGEMLSGIRSTLPPAEC